MGMMADMSDEVELYDVIRKVRGDLSLAIAAVGDYDRAEKATTMVGSADRRAELRVDLARSLAEAGDTRRAASVAAGITIDGRRTDAFLEIVRALIRDGHFDQAVIAARSIASHDARSEGLLLVVQAAARAGELDLARDIALTIPGPAWQAWALDCVAATTPASVRPRPGRVVRKPPRHDLVPEAGRSLLRRLMQTPDPTKRLRRDAAEAFVADGSRAPLITLLHHYPAVVSAVAAETLILMAKP